MAEQVRFTLRSILILTGVLCVVLAVKGYVALTWTPRAKVDFAFVSSAHISSLWLLLTATQRKVLPTLARPFGLIGLFCGFLIAFAVSHGGINEAKAEVVLGCLLFAASISVWGGSIHALRLGYRKVGWTTFLVVIGCYLYVFSVSPIFHQTVSDMLMPQYQVDCELIRNI